MLLTIETLLAAVLNGILCTVVWMRFRAMIAAWFFIAAIGLRTSVAVADQICRIHAATIQGIVQATVTMWIQLPLLSGALLLFFLSIYSPDWLTRRRILLIATPFILLAAACVATSLRRSAPYLASGRIPDELRALYPHPAASGLFNASWLPTLTYLTIKAVRLRPERRPIFLVLGTMLAGTALGFISIQVKALTNAKALFDVVLTGSLAYLLFRRRIFETTKVAIDRALGSMIEGVAVLSAEGRVLFTNPAMERYMRLHAGELAEEEQLFGEHLRELLGADFAQMDIDRDSRSLVLAATPIYDAERCLQGHLLLARDVTEARRRDRELSQQNSQLERALEVQRKLLADLEEKTRAEAAAYRAKTVAEAANAAKSAFLANMSHELRTPLNAILGFAQLLGRDPSLSDATKRSLITIDRSGQHLLGLINNVLELSKIEAARAALNESPFDLHRTLAGLHDMFLGRARDKGITLLLERAPDLPQHVKADEGKLRQILINLLGNALNHTRVGGVTLRARRAARPTNGAEPETIRLRFEVKDTGAGIAPGEQDKLFEKFTTLPPRGDAVAGTGLGLSISREFARLMGGDIHVTSALGEGATFSFEIEAAPALATEVSREAVETGAVIGIAPGQPRYRVLVADDQWENRDLLVQLLTTIGFDVRGVANGREAVDVWREWEPHLIWMDMRMPVMDGYEATKQIKSSLRGQATVIIAITASAFEHDRATVLSAGCDDFVRKPFRDAEIFDRMARHIGVKFTYTAPRHSEPPSASAPLSKRAIAALPPELRDDLRRAATSLSTKSMQGVLERVRRLDPRAADALSAIVRGYRFDRVIALLDEETAP